jgi:hypothetical protein
MGVSGQEDGSLVLLGGSPLIDGQARLADAGWTGRGRVVRPYALTGGRTEPADSRVLDTVAIVVARPDPGDAAPALSPEQQAILSRCGGPVPVRDLVSGLVTDLGLPLGVVRVLLADLAGQGLINVVPRRSRDQRASGRKHRPRVERPSVELLREVLRGLQAL